MIRQIFKKNKKVRKKIRAEIRIGRDRGLAVLKVYIVDRCFVCPSCSMLHSPDGADYFCGKYFKKVEDLEIIQDFCRLEDYLE